MLRARWSRWWVLVAGIVLIALASTAYGATPYPELRQIGLTVISEEPDGRCEVRWRDPYGASTARDREGAYRCDPDRDARLKAPDHDPATGFGYDAGWVLAEGKRKGELYSPDEYEDTGGVIGDYLFPVGLLVAYFGLLHAGVRLRWRRKRPGGRAPTQG
ncbi:hypothetical protein ABT024_32160 [Streptomyces sp. NPDC002812]|uniref:hypothetical protein n=1 Tax=Streptomyces sp. NPDC002812 TaxID=3154434 RepID=UPI00332F7990